MFPSLNLKAGPATCIVVALASLAHVVFDATTGDVAVQLIRILHWCVTFVGIGYPFLFAPEYDVAFVAAWTLVIVSWVAWGNACILSLVEANRDPRALAADPTMKQLPMPWLPFAILLITVAFRLPQVTTMLDRGLLFAGLATYVAVHYVTYSRTRG